MTLTFISLQQSVNGTVIPPQHDDIPVSPDSFKRAVEMFWHYVDLTETSVSQIS